MIDPKMISAGVQILKASKDAKQIQKALEGDKDLIKGIMSSVTGQNMSAQDIRTFAEMTRMIGEQDLGPKALDESGKHLSPAKLATTLIGGPWAIVADVAGAAAGNFGKAAAQNIRNKAALGEAAVQSKYWASPEQEARWGVNPMKRAALYAALKNRTKKENLANILEAAANTISSVLGTSVGAYRQGKMLEAMRDNPLTKAQIDAARNPYGSTAERARKAIQSLSSSK